MHRRQFFVALSSVAVALLLLVFLGVRQYDGNVSALFHLDATFGEAHQVPGGIVLYSDAGYDGMLYYQIARDIPTLFSGGTPSLDSPYRFQRIVLPLFAFILALGQEAFFPYTILLINLAAALGALALTLLITKKVNVHSLTVVLNPAVLIGIIYTLTEPLSLFFMMLFFWLWTKHGQQMTALGVLALTLSLFARETTVFLIVLLGLWYVLHRNWKAAVLCGVPLVPFFLWQVWLKHQLGSVAFQANSNVVSLPFSGPFELIVSSIEHLNAYHLSALSLLVFLLLVCTVLGREWLQQKTKINVFSFLMGGLCATMLCMDAHMWAVITSIGRVVTPFYPVYALYASQKDTTALRVLSVALLLLSVVAAIGAAVAVHPYTIS